MEIRDLSVADEAGLPSKEVTYIYIYNIYICIYPTFGKGTYHLQKYFGKRYVRSQGAEVVEEKNLQSII